LNTFIGWGFSILLFIAGVGIPTNTTETANTSVDLSVEEVSVENPVWAANQEVREADPGFRAKRSLPQFPPVKSDHEGHRKEVPGDPSKRCPKLEPVFEAYGLYPIQTWSYIAWRESGCRPKAQNAKWKYDIRSKQGRLIRYGIVANQFQLVLGSKEGMRGQCCRKPNARA
jgi:hypothetical protein